MIKKLFLLTLALCMVLSLLPVAPVLAETTTTDASTQSKEPTAVAITSAYNDRYTERQLQVGQSTRLYAAIYPAGAGSGITWESSDPDIVRVDAWGMVTALNQGQAIVTATTYNGKTASCRIDVPDGLPELQYQLTVDGKGYEIVGYDAGAYAAHIPATYNGLPVVSIKGGAFKDCIYLRYFTVDAAQQTFYAEGGVIFTNDPEKTLVCFPPAYDLQNYYIVPEGTVKIAPYAFAGLLYTGEYLINTLHTITIPEGVREIGERAFYEVHWQVSVYVPDSLTVIGEHLLEGQTDNVPFYGNEGCAFEQYAQVNRIPFGFVVDDYQNLPTTVKTGVPTNDDLSTIPVLDEGSYFICENIYSVCYSNGKEHYFAGGYIDYTFDLSAYEAENDCEIRLLLLEQLYGDIILDPNGNNAVGFAEPTGLYGMGHTEGDAILRAYDRDGTLIAAKRVNGNFAFSFPGAYNLGVEGGTNTTLTVLPVEPIFVTSPGSYQVNPEEWYQLPDGNIVQYFVLCFPSPSISPDFPDYLNNLSQSLPDYGGTGYAVMVTHTNSAALVDQMNLYSVVFEGMECLLDNDEFACWMSSSYGKTKDYAENAYDILSAVKNVMVGNYYPTSAPIIKAILWGDGSYPHASVNIIRYEDLDTVTMAHEMIHIVDNSTVANQMVAPSAWMEGRAEHISRLVCEALEVPGYQGYSNHYGYNIHSDWSFLSEAQKEDFFYYYYFSVNRYTAYDVGYYFLCYLNRTYGEDVSARIMENIVAVTGYDYHQDTEVNAALFKKCVEDATEVGVFQRFVCDVIEGGKHVPATDAAVETTCAAPGWTEGSSCAVCNKVYVPQQMIPVLPHTPGQIVIENIQERTCTDYRSHDEVIYCTVCEGEVSREKILEEEPLGHTEVVDEATDATCVKTGWTEGKHCGVCQEVLLAQEKVPALGHHDGEPVQENLRDSTCIREGRCDNVIYCTLCKAELRRETITLPAKGHVEVIRPAVETSCAAPGWTEGTVCALCNKVFVPQEMIPALPHTPGQTVVENILPPGCTDYASYDNVTYCSVCNGEASRETIIEYDKPPQGHKEATLLGVEPTCYSSGWTEGVICHICQAVLEPRQKIPTSHNFGEWTVITEATTETTGEEVRSCAFCSKKETRSIEKLTPPAEPAPGNNSGSTSDSGNSGWIFIAVAAVAVGAALTLILLKKKK